jgi:predicted DsbA family dithiol-disulfide isomerase
VSIEKLKKEHNVRTQWIHFPLHPDTPQEGQLLSEMFKHIPAENLDAMRDNMRNLMAEAGLPYGDRTTTYNSRLAQELGYWADTQEGGETLHDLLFKAYFVDILNINDQDVLIELAGKAGLDQVEATRILEGRIYSPQVNSDWERAWKEGVTGVPTFTAMDLHVVGCQPYEVLERFVNHLRELQRNEIA